MAQSKKPGGAYNQYSPRKDDEAFERPWKTTFVSSATLRALEELEYITSWAEFVEICEKQKRKRGW